MTKAKPLIFYVNKPDITSGTLHSLSLPVLGEKTVVLGCYIGNDSGIYLYNVTDPDKQCRASYGSS